MTRMASWKVSTGLFAWLASLAMTAGCGPAGNETGDSLGAFAAAATGSLEKTCEHYKSYCDNNGMSSACTVIEQFCAWDESSETPTWSKELTCNKLVSGCNASSRYTKTSCRLHEDYCLERRGDCMLDSPETFTYDEDSCDSEKERCITRSFKGPGECVPADQGCMDTDGGKNTSIRGKTTGKGRTEEDDCIPSGAYEGYVREYFCSEFGGINMWSIKCPDGTRCKEGACSTACTLDDPSTPGVNEDSCKEGWRCVVNGADDPRFWSAPGEPRKYESVPPQCVLEVPCPANPAEPCPFAGLYCDGDICAPTRCHTAKADPCPSGSTCQKGLCIFSVPNNTCLETDGGQDLFVKGYNACRKSGTLTLEIDHCYSGPLSEHYDLFEWNELSGGLRKCPDGTRCEEGACTPCENGVCGCYDPDAGDDDIYQATSIGLQADECVNLGWFEEGMPAVKELQCDGKDVVSTVKECWANPDGSGALTSCYQGACLRMNHVQNRTREDFELVRLVHAPGDDGACLPYTSIWEEKKGEEVISRTEARNSSPSVCGNVVAVQRILAKAAFTSGTIDADQLRSYMEKRGYVLDPKTGVFLADGLNRWFSASADGRYLYSVMYFDWGADHDPLENYLLRYPPNVINTCPSEQILLPGCGCVSNEPINCWVGAGTKVGSIHSMTHDGNEHAFEACRTLALQVFTGPRTGWDKGYFACGETIRDRGTIVYQQAKWGSCIFYQNSCP